MLPKTCMARKKTRKEPERMICNLSSHAGINLLFNKLEKETKSESLVVDSEHMHLGGSSPPRHKWTALTLSTGEHQSKASSGRSTRSD